MDGPQETEKLNNGDEETGKNAYKFEVALEKAGEFDFVMTSGPVDSFNASCV